MTTAHTLRPQRDDEVSALFSPCVGGCFGGLMMSMIVLGDTLDFADLLEWLFELEDFGVRGSGSMRSKRAPTDDERGEPPMWPIPDELRRDDSETAALLGQVDIF